MPLVDIVVIAIVIICLLVGMYLGCVRVISGIGGWIGAALATLYGFPHVRPLARSWIADSLIADAVAGIALFVVTLILLSFISHAISARIRESGLRPVDRSLGLLVGLAIGVLIVSAAYLIIDQGTEKEDRPQWFQQAKTGPIVRRTAYFLWSFAPSQWQAEAPQASGARNRLERAQDAQRVMRDLINPTPKENGPAEKDGYTEKEREEMDRLIRGQN